MGRKYLDDLRDGGKGADQADHDHQVVEFRSLFPFHPPAPRIAFRRVHTVLLDRGEFVESGPRLAAEQEASAGDQGDSDPKSQEKLSLVSRHGSIRIAPHRMIWQRAIKLPGDAMPRGISGP
jgi:hypothetical protein